MNQEKNKEKDDLPTGDIKKGLDAVDKNRNKPYNTPIEKKDWTRKGLFDFSKPKKKNRSF